VNALAAGDSRRIDAFRAASLSRSASGLTNGPAHGGAAWNYVTPHFFNTFKIPVVRGRVFTERDDGAAPPVVVINEAMARQYWKSEEPLGQRLIIGSGMGPDFAQAPREIIGRAGHFSGLATSRSCAFPAGHFSEPTRDSFRIA
jgi:hypothetical protein